MAIEALEGVTDEELFNDANSDEAPAEEVVAEPAEVTEQSQARDEQGKFAAKADEPAATDQPVKTQVDDNAPQVPSWRVREINDEKLVLANKVAALEAERTQWQRQQPRAQVEPPAPARAEAPDPLLDPKGHEKYMDEKFEEKLLNFQRETSLAQAHRTYKTEFEEAYAAAQKHIDPALKARMQQSRDPGETLIEWHRELKTRAEVGNDPNAYFDRRFEAYLADPANQAKVLERIRGAAQPQPGARQGAPAVSLPPSLTRATNASSDISADDDDVSDDGLWRHANA
jgi:hypothetical protein